MRGRFAVDMIVNRGNELEPMPQGAVSKIEYAPNLVVRASTSRRRKK